MEFTWTHGCALESGEFRHGPLEIVEQGVPFIFLLGTDGSRHTTERALNFVKRYTDNVIVFDYADLSQGLDPMLAPMVLLFHWNGSATTLPYIKIIIQTTAGTTAA